MIEPESAAVEIRKAESLDASAVWALRNNAIRHQCVGHYPKEDLKIWTAGPMSDRFVRTVHDHFYVATINRVVVGTGMLNTVSGQIDAVFVSPDRMGRGVGRQIMAFLEKLAIDAGLSQLTLDSTINAQPFYEKCGFVSIERGVYNSPRGISLECVMMAKRLTERIHT